MTKRESKKKILNPTEILKSKLAVYLKEYAPLSSLPDDIPSKWEKHGDLVILPSWSFQHTIWSINADEVWEIVATVLKCNRIAKKNPIHNDNFRSPCVEILKGSDPWVLHIDNKIKYTFDVTKCMFSAGNISEKLRIAQLNCQGETVVDLYSGIGYFTLPFLIHAGASFVHACEWNPYAIEALSKNLAINGVKDRCTIYYGDNKEVCPQKVADRVNLGLIPSSEEGWETACRALKPSGGVLHVHGNVTYRITNKQNKVCSSQKTERTDWAMHISLKMKNILVNLYHDPWTTEVQNVVRIKSYAPHIDHLVVDIVCKPLKKI